MKKYYFFTFFISFLCFLANAQRPIPDPNPGEFAASLSNCSFNWTSPNNGTFTASVEGYGAAEGITSTTGEFSSTVEPDGTVRIFASGKAQTDTKYFSSKTNFVMTPDRKLSSTYSSVILIDRKTKKKYVSRKATASGNLS